MALEQISNYFTTSTLDEIIKNAGGKEHTSYSFGSGFKKGDSYLSQVFRLKVEGTRDNGSLVEVNVIVKSMPKNADRRKLFRSSDFFRNEINFYTKVIPEFEAFQKLKNPKDPFVEYPKCFATYSDGENDFIALEDLGAEGYVGASRHEGVSLDLCSLILKSLGRFHGLSLALKDQNPKLFEKICDSIEEVYYADKFKEWYTPFLEDAKNVAIHAVSTEYPKTTYEKKTKEFLNGELYDKLIHLTSTRTKYSVIGHGDCWTPNFLIKYKDHSTSDANAAIKIIDFQLTRCGSPALDLTFFLYSCTHNDFREMHYEKILQAYYSGVSGMIKDLGSDPEKVFPFSALQSELREFGCFGCGMGIESLPMSMLEDDEVTDLEAINGENVLTDVWKIYPIKDKEKRLRIATAFKHAIDNGYI